MQIEGLTLMPLSLPPTPVARTSRLSRPYSRYEHVQARREVWMLAAGARRPSGMYAMERRQRVRPSNINEKIFLIVWGVDFDLRR